MSGGMRALGRLAVVLAAAWGIAGAAYAEGDAAAGADEAGIGKGAETVKLFPVVKDEKWGYIDETGKVAIEPQFEFAWDFYEGLACVGQNALRGYIDRTGETVIPVQFGWATRFSEGRAVVHKNADRFGRNLQWYRPRKGYAVIDRGGKTVVALGPNMPSDFSDGLSWAGARTNNYLDMEGRQIPLAFDEGSRFSEGLAAVRKDYLWGFIDNTMNPVIEPRFHEALWFSEGLAPVAEADTPPPEEGGKAYKDWCGRRVLKWGYADRSGKLVIDCRFEQALSFSEGLAPVRVDGKWGYVHTSGAVVVEPRYEYAWPFSEGRGRVLVDAKTEYVDGGKEQVHVGKKHGYVDKKGKMVIEPRFDAAWEFSKGLARVGVGDCEGYIDHEGTFVWEPTK